MDPESELARAKWLLVAGAIFLVSGCVSWGELVYLVSGKTAQAEVTNAYETVRRRFGIETSRQLTIDYAFNEPDGTRRIGTDSVSPNWRIPESGYVAVRYTPGADGSSRLAGNVHWFGLVFFLISMGAIVIFGIRLWRQAAEATGGMRPKKKMR
jgi:hypothetical protein